MMCCEWGVIMGKKIWSKAWVIKHRLNKFNCCISLKKKYWTRPYRQLTPIIYHPLKKSPHKNLFHGHNRLGQSFPLEELRAALHNEKNTAPGIDCILYGILKHLPLSSLVSFCRTFNTPWAQSLIPDAYQRYFKILSGYSKKIQLN